MAIFDLSKNLQNGYVRGLAQQDSMLKSVAIENWSNQMRTISEVAQNGFGNPMDIAAYLRKYRGFVNVGGSDAIVTINGERHTLQAGKTYCASQSEAQLMLEQSMKFDLGLTLGTQADFGINGVVESFYS